MTRGMLPQAPAAPHSRTPVIRSIPVLLLALSLILGLTVRYRAANHDYIAQWDEAYHALVAKNLTINPFVPTLNRTPLLSYDYTDWRDNHIWLHKPPLPLWLMSFSIWALGPVPEISFRLPSVLLGTLSILLTFMIARELWGASGLLPGAIAALLQALNPLLVQLVAGILPADHVDLILVFFIELSILFFAIGLRQQDRWVMLSAGVALGLAYLSKSAPAFLAAGVALSLLFSQPQRRRGSLRLFRTAIVGFAIVVIPWSLYCTLRWPQEFAWESSYTIKHLFQVIEGHAHPVTFFFDRIPSHYYGGVLGLVVITGSALYFVVDAMIRRDSTRLPVLAWAFLPYLVFSVAKTKLSSYVAPAVPAVLLMVGTMFSSLLYRWRARNESTSGSAERRNATRHAVQRTVSLCAACLALAYVFSLLNAALAMEFPSVPANYLYDYAAFRTALLQISLEPRPKVLFNVGDNKTPQAMYYSNAPAYSHIPSLETVKSLIDEGRRVYVLEDDEGRNRTKLEALRQSGLDIEIIAIRSTQSLTADPRPSWKKRFRAFVPEWLWALRRACCM